MSTHTGQIHTTFQCLLRIAIDEDDREERDAIVEDRSQATAKDLQSAVSAAASRYPSATGAKVYLYDRNEDDRLEGDTVLAFEVETQVDPDDVIAFERAVTDAMESVEGVQVLDTSQETLTSTDRGLTSRFIDSATQSLEALGIDARLDFPGILVFHTADGREWATGYTGLHVSSNEGHGDQFPGDEHLVAFESRGTTLSVDEYTAAVRDLVERYNHNAL